MNITIPIAAIQAARKLLTRIRFERLKLPVLNHVLVTIDAAGLSLAVTDLDHWLETRVTAIIDPFTPERFLIPAEALKAATRGDKKSTAHFTYTSTADGTTLTLTVSCGGMNVVTVYHPEPASGFPARPAIAGRITAMPKETIIALQTVAGCASIDATRHVLNGVLFSPDDGGILVATDGRRLAGAPVRFAGRQFILPNAAVQVLAHPDFIARDAAILQADATDSHQVQIRSGPHTFIATTIQGTYPNYRLVIPNETLAEATIPNPPKSALISWLRSLVGKSNSVRLTWGRPGPLTLTYPVTALGDRAYVSRMDLVKLMDPVLRPTFIKNAGDFRTVILDAGHGGKDPGATNSLGTEAGYNLKLASQVNSLLAAQGFKVIMTRNSNIYLSLQKRVDIANAVQENAIFVCIHFNSGGGAARGIETFTLSPPGVSHYGRDAIAADNQTRTGNEHDSANIALATSVHGSLLRRLQTNTFDRGIKHARSDELAEVRYPAILLQGGFMTHPYEMRLIDNPKYQDALAKGVVEGIVKYRFAVAGIQTPPAELELAAALNRDIAALWKDNGADAQDPPPRLPDILVGHLKKLLSQPQIDPLMIDKQRMPGLHLAYAIDQALATKPNDINVLLDLACSGPGEKWQICDSSASTKPDQTHSIAELLIYGQSLPMLNMPWIGRFSRVLETRRKSAIRLQEQAMEFLKNGDSHAAKKRLEQAVKEYPSLGITTYSAGLELYDSLSCDKALRAVDGDWRKPTLPDPELLKNASNLLVPLRTAEGTEILPGLTQLRDGLEAAVLLERFQHDYEAAADQDQPRPIGALQALRKTEKYRTLKNDDSFFARPFVARLKSLDELIGPKVAEYEKLLEQAREVEKDGKHLKATGIYRAALALEYSKELEQTIYRCEAKTSGL